MPGIGPDELGRLFDRHAPALRLYARQHAGAPDDAIQEAFLALARQRTVPDRVVPWLYRVVANAARASRRGDRRRVGREARAARPDLDGDWFAGLDDRIDARAARNLLEGLDPAIRSAVVARIWGTLTFEEIAQAEGCSVATAHRRYRLGLAQLHERMADRDG